MLALNKTQFSPMDTKILQGPKLYDTPTTTIGQFFFDYAQKHQHQICHVDASTDKDETFFEINQRSTRVALSMLKQGVTFNDVIMTCSIVTLDTPVPILGAFYLGAKVANLDPTLSVRQTSHLLSLVCPRMVFTEEASVDLIEQSLQLAKLQTEIVVFGKSAKYATFASFIVEQPEEKNFKPVAVDVQEIILMFFSSGTTGLPKAICHTHQSLLSLLHSFYRSGSHYDTALTCTSFYWISAMLYFGCSFLSGGRKIVCSSKWEPEDLFSYIEKYKVTCMFVAPILLSQMATYKDHYKYNLASVYSVLSAGNLMSTNLINKFYDIFKHTHLIFGYGLSEVGVATIFNPLTDQHLMRKKMSSAGKPTFGISIKIVDVENREVLGPHEKGEICVKSASLMKEYYKDDSSNVFDNDGFLKTGDVGFYDEDNCVYFVERLKEMFKYLSWHIVPSALEAVLHEHPNVKEAVVFGLPRNEEEGEVPTACVVLKNDNTVKEEEIQDFVAARVSDRERLRGGVYFFKELFRTPTGKIVRREIKNYVTELLEKKNCT